MIINSSTGYSLPPQMLSLKEKDEVWKKKCLDALESIGRHQYFENSRLLENYEMVKGKFIFAHYIEREDYADLISQLTKEFEIPSHLRHYDIISQVINTLSGEYQKRPDVFRVKAFGEAAMNNFLRTKTELIIQYVMEELNAVITEKLMKEGLDPNRQDFASEEEAQAYQQQIAQAKQAMTPPEIEKYMNTSWMDAAEIWAEYCLEADKQRFKLAEKEKIEFEDMLISDRCFRHFYLTLNGYNQETWNPINTFYHKSPEVLYVENGDYVGRVFYLTIPEIINRYGHKMTEEQLLVLEETKKEAYDSNTSFGYGEGTHWGNIKNGSVIPFKNYSDQKMVTDHLGFNPNSPETFNEYNMSVALGDTGVHNYFGMYQVTEGYWMSQRKIGKYVYMDTETGVPMTAIVDETFKLKGIQELDNAFMELGVEESLNTVTWTWVNQVWKGIKIGNIIGNLSEPLYIEIEPNEFQFKGDVNIYGAKLPVCGQVFSNRNADSMSLVDLMKPHQIGYNVAMNQLYEIMQREIGRFMLMDINMIPSSGDWGGPGNMERFMLVARQLGIGPVDTSPANAHQANFAHFQPVDLDESARMISRLKIAEAFEQFALKQVGITPQRLGSITASETATGTEQAVNQSYAQTESYFTNFSNYKSRCMQMNLEIAQYSESNKEEVIVSYIRSDMSRAFTKMAGTDLLMSELGVMVVNSREIQRQLEMMRTLFLNNNTVGASPVDIATVIMSNSPAEIKVQMETSWKKTQDMQQQQQQAQQEVAQQQIQAAAQEAERQRMFEAEQNDLDRANERYLAEVRAIGSATLGQGTDPNGNGVPDALEVQKFNAELGKHSEDILFKRQQEANKSAQTSDKMKLEQDKLKMSEKELEAQREENEKDRQVERENMKNDLDIAKMNAKNRSQSKTKK